jgi:hypothetical protein
MVRLFSPSVQRSDAARRHYSQVPYIRSKSAGLRSLATDVPGVTLKVLSVGLTLVQIATLSRNHFSSGHEITILNAEAVRWTNRHLEVRR